MKTMISLLFRKSRSSSLGNPAVLMSRVFYPSLWRCPRRSEDPSLILKVPLRFAPTPNRGNSRGGEELENGVR